MGRRVVSDRLAAHIQARTVSAAYGDTAAVLSYTVTTLDTYGQPNVTTTTTAISCSFSDKPNPEKWKGYADIGMLAAEIRFASPAPAKGYKVTLKGRFDGTGYVDKTYEIIGIRDRDAFGYVCALKVAEL